MLIVVNIVANGYFAVSKIALVSARVSRLNQLRTGGLAGAAEAIRLKEAPESLLATIQIAITLVGTLASAVGGATAVEALTPWLAWTFRASIAGRVWSRSAWSSSPSLICPWCSASSFPKQSR